MTSTVRVAVALLLLAPLAWTGSLATAQVVGTAAAGARTETALDNEFKTDGRGTPWIRTGRRPG